MYANSTAIPKWESTTEQSLYNLGKMSGSLKANFVQNIFLFFMKSMSQFCGNVYKYRYRCNSTQTTTLFMTEQDTRWVLAMMNLLTIKSSKRFSIGFRAGVTNPFETASYFLCTD